MFKFLKNILILVLILLVVANFSESKSSMDQMKKAVSMMRVACQQKLKLTDEKVDSLEKDLFPDDKDVKCYVNCVLEMMNTMKKGKMNYENAIKQVDIMMPDDHKEPIRKALNACRYTATDIKDHCEASYAVMRCLYENNEEFFFP